MTTRACEGNGPEAEAAPSGKREVGVVDIVRVLQSDGDGEEEHEVAGVEEVVGDRREEMARTALWGSRRAVEALDKAIFVSFWAARESCSTNYQVK